MGRLAAESEKASVSRTANRRILVISIGLLLLKMLLDAVQCAVNGFKDLFVALSGLVGRLRTCVGKGKGDFGETGFDVARLYGERPGISLWAIGIPFHGAECGVCFEVAFGNIGMALRFAVQADAAFADGLRFVDRRQVMGKVRQVRYESKHSVGGGCDIEEALVIAHAIIIAVEDLMSILDKLFGHEEQPKRQEAQQPYPPQQQPYQQQANQQAAPPPAQSADQQAIARYQYMLKTAPPETIEQAHQEAFAQLSPDQRKQVLQQLSSAVPPSERPPLSAADDPQALARAATRAEVRQPGTLERLFGSSGAPGGGGGGMGMGGTLLTGLAGAFVGTAIADHFFRGPMGSGFMGGGMGMGGLGGGAGGYGGGGTTINETTNNYGSDSDDDDKDDDDKDSGNDDSGDNSSSDDSSFDDSADYSDAGGDDSGGGSDA